MDKRSVPHARLVQRCLTVDSFPARSVLLVPSLMRLVCLRASRALVVYSLVAQVQPTVLHVHQVIIIKISVYQYVRSAVLVLLLVITVQLPAAPALLVPSNPSLVN